MQTMQATIESEPIPIRDVSHYLPLRHHAVSIFSGGGDISEQLRTSTEQLDTLFSRMIAGESPVLVFDIDGTLMEGGLEVGTKKDKTVREYLSKNREAFVEFKAMLQKFKRRYFGEVIICTGRGRVFAEMIADTFFGVGLVDQIISEGGGMIQDDQGTRMISDIEEHFPELIKFKTKLISYVLDVLGGTFEEGKDICISFNPPNGIGMVEFRNQIEDFLQQEGADMTHIYVTNSNSAVDINPHGIDKLIAMQSEVQTGIVIYFGDAANDRTAMENFANINIVPQNADPQLQDDVVKKSGSSDSQRSLLGIIGEGNEIYGVNDGLRYLLHLYESLGSDELQDLLRSFNVRAMQIIHQIEREEPATIQQRLMISGLSETGPLYDRVFYRAETISTSSAGTTEIHIHSSDGFVRLNDTVPMPGTPTILSIRNREESGILFSGVAAVTIITDEGIFIPVLKRDAGAPVDAGKYTLPAGRADKTPGRVALEELLEELLIFGTQDGAMIQVVPYIEDQITIQKARKLAEIARNKYLAKLLIDGSPIIDILPYMGTKMALLPLGNNASGSTVITHIGGGSVSEDGIHPFYDESVNTFEMIRSLNLDLSGFGKITFGDGDGFGRSVGVFSREQLLEMDLDEQVASLSAALRLGAI